MKNPIVFGFLMGAGLVTGLAAETEISFYFGQQSAPPSHVRTQGDRVIPDLSFRQRWTGQSFEMPIYAGARITRWRTDRFGWGLDFAHNKVKPARGTMPAGFRRMEFTDGLNTWTVNAYYRWPEALGAVTPYVGAGLGLSVPGVEIRYIGSDTFNYQVTGLAGTWLVGLSRPLNEHWSVFGEYKGTYTSNVAKLSTGGTFSSDIVTHAVNFGLGYRF